MKMQKTFKILFFALILVAAGFFCQPAQAAFNLTYQIDQGGSRLELDRTNFSRAVTLTTTNSTGSRYEIRQRFESPLRSRDNPSVTINDNFVVRAFRGTNRYGDLRISPSDITVRNDELIYVSSTAGDEDSLTLSYSVRNVGEIAPGTYTGRVIFVLNPINSALPPATQVVDVYVTISDEGGSLTVSVEPAEGSGSIIVNPSKSNDLRGSDCAVVKINSAFNGPFKIMQMLPQKAQSSEGKAIESSNLVFNIPDAQKGVAVNQPTPVASNLQTIYSSRPDGSADQAFTIAYALADPVSVVAGNYRSRIQYFLESAGKQVNLGALDLEVRQERIFEMTVAPQDQRSSIDFADLKPNEAPRVSEVVIEVKSNLGKQYQVTQDILSELGTVSGDKILGKYFTMQTLPEGETKGSLKINEKIPAEKGNAVLFISDSRGSADKFKVSYELTCSKDLKAGSYASRITYTLTEI